MRIIIFGDSISEGFWDYENGGWANRLKIDFWKKYGYDKMIFNAGVSAYTTENLLNCFDSTFDAISRREPGKEKDTIIVFAIGINDSAEYIDTGDKRVEITKFEQNIQALIDKCQKEKLIQNIIFLSAINVEEDIINAEDSLGAEHYFYNGEIQRYNSVIQKLTEENRCSYIDMFGLMQKCDLEDGLHPSSQGHKKIYEKVLKFIENK